MSNGKDLNSKIKKILIIDDEPQILLISAVRLKANGYAVMTALSGKEGLEKARAELPDLVLLDYIMPEMDGAEVLAQFKKDPAMKHIPVVMFTADTKRVKAGEFLARGAIDCLYKPFLPEEILAKAEEVFGKKV